MRVGIIGLGYWGPNLVRVLSSIPDCEVTAFCDLNPERLRTFCERFPDVYGTRDSSQVLTNERVDAVVIATPTVTHYPLARQALEQGLHVFVEKPLANSTAECEELIELAEQRNRTLFVGHVFLYTAAVARLKEMVTTGELGDLYYMSATRLNLGPVRRDVNALWDLAPHDISIMIDLMGESPVAVSCTGLAYLDSRVHDVCALTMHFESNRMGIIHVSWLDPHKKREMTVVGSKKMAIYNDVETLEKIKVYDHGVDQTEEPLGEFPFQYRYGDIYSPRLKAVEPLKEECRSFVDCIARGATPRTDGHNGLEVVRVIEAADQSLALRGREVEVPGLAGGADPRLAVRA